MSFQSKNLADSPPEDILFATKNILFVTEKMLFVTENMFFVTEKPFSEAMTVF